VFYFAWVDPDAPDYAGFGPDLHRVDEDIFAFSLDQGEGEAATLSLTVRASVEGLLAPGRMVWAWFAWDDGSTVHPLFFGRVSGSPDQVEADFARIVLYARPSDLAAAKESAAAPLRVLPYFDPVFLSAEARSDPDAVLEGRSAVWHVDRVSHAITASDVLEGEAGVVAVSALAGSVDLRIVAAPVAAVRIDCEMTWKQSAAGSLDISGPIREAFAAAGSPRAGFPASYTGEGLANDWPREGDRIGGGWSVGRVEIARADGVTLPQSYMRVLTDSGLAIRFPLWELAVSMEAAFSVERPRSERVSLLVSAGLQPMMIDGVGEPEVLSLSTSAVGEAIDGAYPIGNLARRSYVQTDRGRASLLALVARARARLRSRARAIEVTAEIPFAEGVGLTLRHNATIASRHVPGGVATGKVAGLSLSMREGRLSASLRIGCSVGDGAAYAGAAVSSSYVGGGYVAEGYIAASAGSYDLASADAGLPAYGDVVLDDDGVDLESPTVAAMVQSVAVTNGPADQIALQRMDLADGNAAAEALRGLATSVVLQMQPLDGRSFATLFDLGAVSIALPSTIDLQAEV